MNLANNNIVTFDELGSLGRLGNSLFQIAAVVGIANELGYLAVFPEFENSKYFKGVFKKEEIINRNKFLYREPFFHFQNFDWSEVVPLSIETKNPTEFLRLNLYGYFQSEKYFENCIDEVLSMFEFEDSLRKKCKTIYKEILLTNKKNLDTSTCAIHMRFGDYLDNKGYYTQLAETHYYPKAINYIERQSLLEQNKYPLFLIFSDDNEKAEEALKKLGFAKTNSYLIINNLNDVESFCLQSLCDNFITANSSYSWWASYLSKNENKIVVAPRSWFGKDAVGLNTKDLYRKDMVLF